jgi:hypothetical protein
MMAEITVRLNDKKYRYKFNLATLDLFEKKTGIKLGPAMKGEWGYKEASILLWAGLVQDKPSLSLGEVKRFVSYHYTEVTTWLSEAFDLFSKERRLK